MAEHIVRMEDEFNQCYDRFEKLTRYLQTMDRQMQLEGNPNAVVGAVQGEVPPPVQTGSLFAYDLLELEHKRTQCYNMRAYLESLAVRIQFAKAKERLKESEQ